MKHFFLLSSFLLIHFLTCSQPNIDKIIWVGENNEHLNISKTTVSLQKENKFKQFDVVKYVKKDYIILSKVSNSIKVEQKYSIIRFTQDTLILAPEGPDLFELAEANKQNQYVFINSLLAFKFVSLYYETPIDNREGELIRVAIYIDSAKNSKIALKDEISNKTKTYKSFIDKRDYEQLIEILLSCDLSNYPVENNRMDDKNCRRKILEIRYKDQVRTFKGCDGTALIPSEYSELSVFLAEYVSLKANIDIRSERRKR